MNAKALLDQGNLSAAIAQLTDEVRANPTAAPLRIFLFELICFTGNFDRAGKQLDIIAHQNQDMQIGAGVYRQLLESEKVRRSVFFEDGTPGFLGRPPEYATHHLEALRRLNKGEAPEARLLLEKASQLRIPCSGEMEGRPFMQFEDLDPFLAPFLEAVVNGAYCWLPFEEIERIEIAAPQQLRDLLWARARVDFRGGEAGEVFLPVLYAGSSDHPDDAVRLGRTTDWIEMGERLVRGAGRRIFLVDDEERDICGLTEVHLSPGRLIDAV